MAAALVLLIGAGHSPPPGSPGVSRSVRATTAAAETRRAGALFRDGSHFCSASVVRSPGRDLLVTAAHCLAGGAAGLSFVPAYHDGGDPYGSWQVVRTFTDDDWNGFEDADDDVAFAEVAPLDGRRLQDVVGGERLDASGVRDGRVTLIGYPASEEAPRVCANRIGTKGSTQLRIDCTGYAGGTSGGPWLSADGAVIGVIGGYQQGGDTDDTSYSVAFGPAVAALYATAERESSDG